MYKQPSMNSMYQSTYYKDVKRDEERKLNNRYNAAQNPMETGIIPKPSFASQFAQIADIEQSNYSLTGEPMTNNDFAHNNMTPFLKGNITQPSVERMTNIAQRNTGADLYIRKQEQKPFFKPNMYGGNVCGMKNNDDFYKSRINEFKTRNNEFPIQPIRVGPGLNSGYSSEGKGGFHQADTRQYAMPIDTQSTKPKTDQSSKTFQVPIQGPRKSIARRGQLQEVNKNRPDTSFNNTPDKWLQTTGAYTKPTDRETIQNLPATNKFKTHVTYSGVAKDGFTQQSSGDDYGKENVIVYDNERNEYESKTVVANLQSVISAVVAPVIDTVRNSIKEYLLDAPRPHGNMDPQMPQAVTMSDDVARTTLKETMLHDNEPSNLKGQDETYTALHDDARTTLKETMIHDTDPTNLKGNEMGIKALDDEARTTTKETVNIKDVLRNIGGVTYRTVSYDPELTAKKTTKETTIHKSEGFLGGLLEGLFGGYLSANPEAKNVQKQFTHVDYTGTGNFDIKAQMSHEAAEAAEIDGTREHLLMEAGHTPNAGQSNLKKIHNASINMKTNKLAEESLAPRDKHNISTIYQQTPNANACGITKETEQLNSYENRLDTSTLDSLKSNPFNLTINPL